MLVAKSFQKLQQWSVVESMLVEGRSEDVSDESRHSFVQSSFLTILINQLKTFSRTQTFLPTLSLCCCVEGNSHQTLEASSAAAQECVADGPASSSVLAGVRHASCDLHLTVTSSESGAALAREPWWTSREEERKR